MAQLELISRSDSDLMMYPINRIKEAFMDWSDELIEILYHILSELTGSDPVDSWKVAEVFDEIHPEMLRCVDPI